MVTRRHFPFDQHSGTSARGQLRSRLICAHRGRTEGDRRLPNPDIAVAAPRLSTGPLFGDRLAVACRERFLSELT